MILAGKLRSCKPQSTVKKKKISQKNKNEFAYSTETEVGGCSGEYILGMSKDRKE